MVRKGVLLEGIRTPIGRFQGSLAKKSAKELGITVVSELVRTVKSEKVNEVILAQVIQAGQGQNPARQVAVQSGIDPSTPAITLNNVCPAGLSTVADAVRRIERNEGDLFIVGGFESMTNAPHVSVLRQEFKIGSISFYDTLNDGLWCSISDRSMNEVGENSNKELGITREEQDEYAFLSQSRALQARENGMFSEEIVGVKISDQLITQDEGIRPDTTIEKLNKLKSVTTNEGTVTAGNASQLSDGASAGIISTIDMCEKLGKEPLATIIDWAVVAGPDTSLHLQPANAINALLNRTALHISDIDLFEINEAYAGVVIGSCKELGLPFDVVNVNGGAIALGHPLSASGFRLLLTLAKELKRRGGGRGIASMCGGGGQGIAVLIEV